jgi:uncharacterized protein (TIGR02996 family)
MPPIGLLDALLETPDEELPWLALADWLEEHGDADHAELVRLGCQRDCLPPDDPRQAALRQREAALLDANAARWTPTLPGVFFHPVRRRGLPCAVIFTSYEAYSRQAAAVWRCVFIPDVTFHQLPPSRVGPLLRAPHIDRLTTLNFRPNRIRAAGAHALAAEPALAGVKRLLLDGNQIGDEGVRALVASPYTTALRVLDLSGCKVWQGGLEALAAWPGLSRLRELRLDRNSIRHGLVSLAASPGLAGLERLSLRHAELTDATVEALAESPHLDGLRELDLTDCYLGAGPEGLRLLRRFGERVKR